MRVALAAIALLASLTGAAAQGSPTADLSLASQSAWVAPDQPFVARVDVDSAGVATAAGARVGDTEERVKGLYAGRVAVSPHKYEEGNYLTVTPDADTTYAIVFETSKGRVTRFRGGRRPQVEYVEGCS